MRFSRKNLLIATVAIALLGAGGGHFWLRKIALPPLSGNLALWGQQEDVSIEPEPHGVVNIRATNFSILPFGRSHNKLVAGGYRKESWVIYPVPSARQTIDLASLEGARSTVANSQSKNWLATGYGNRLPLWRVGGHSPMHRKGYKVADTLVLTPMQ